MAVCTNQGFKSLVPRDIDGTFLYYQVQRIRSVFERYAAGSTFLEIGKRDTARVPIPHPIDCGLQRKIAAILTSLDTAIEKTEALIEKHQQIKAGLMHDLFTRGVLPNGQLRAMRDRASHHYMHTSSGWTPKEWAIRRLSEMAEIVSGVTVGNAAVRGPSCTVPYLRVANVQDGYLDLSEVKTIRVSSSMFDDLKLVSGDVLMNEGGDFDKLGRGTVWSGEIQDCIHQNHVFRVRTDAAQLDPWFLAFYSESSFGKRYFVLSSKQSTNLASINSTQLKAYPIVTPPIAEQRAIAARLRSANSKTDVFKREVAKLKAQKSGLMQSLLTGRTLVPIDTSGRSFADA